MTAMIWTTAVAPLSAAMEALPGSIKKVEVAPTAGSLDPHKPYITRTSLSANESAAAMDFEVALKMRNFAELEARLAKGEHISLQEMTDRYDPLPTDYEAVADWLTGQGLTIVRRDPSYMSIFVRGSVKQIQNALQVTFGRVTLEGQEYTSAIDAPSVPATLAPLLVGINGLQPHIHKHKHLIKQQVMPNASTGSANYYPNQIAAAYNAAGLYNSNITGSGQTVAIVIDTFPATSDLIAFWKAAKINQSISNIQFIQVVAGTLPSPSGEESLDTEWSSGIAPGVKVRVYAIADSSLPDSKLDTAYQQVYEDVINHPGLGINQMSMSYGGGEADTSPGQLNTDDQKFALLTAAGVTVFASSGDGGSTPGPTQGGDKNYTLQVETPASDPNVTGVGGTSLQLDGNNNITSEVVWNDGTTAGGGGVSSYFARPSWQTGTGVSGSMREVPDVSASADQNYGAVVYLNGSAVVYGGTSWSSPTWAGFCSLLNEARANAGLSTLGLLGPHIYSLIGSGNFRDIVSGNNALSGSTAMSQSGGKYSATTGYDPASGIGSPMVQTLAQTEVGSSSLLGVQVQPTLQSVIPGQSGTVTAAASGSPASYQWQQMPAGSSTWSNVSNAGVFSGATTATLGFSGATSSLTGDELRCAVTYTGGTVVTSSPSTLIVETPLIIQTLAGKTKTSGEVNGTGTAAEFSYPSGSTLDSLNNLYVADYNDNAIREVTPSGVTGTTGVVSTPYGSLTGQAGSSNGSGNSALFKTPNSIVADGANNLYVADTGNNVVRKISGGTVSTFATGFNLPEGIAIDGSGNLYVADTGNDVIKKITPGGAVSVLAGQSGTGGYADGSATSQALFNGPSGVAVDSLGDVFVADFGNEVVREITSGTVKTVAGQGGVAGYMDGPPSETLFNGPNGVGVDSANNVYITDSLVPATTSTIAGNNLLRKMNSSGVVSTLAGTAGIAGSANGTGSSAQFYSLQASAIDPYGRIFLSDTYNQLIRLGGFAPTIGSQPVSLVATVGNQPVSFSVTAAGTGPFAYQWYFNGATISGATSSVYTLASVSGSNAGNYTVTVSNTFGSVTSNAATLIPVTVQPMTASVTAGQSVTFSVTPADSGSFTYQYLFNGAVISTSPSYTINSVSSANAGTYSLVIGDSSGTATSMFTLTVNPAMASDGPTMSPWMLMVLAGLLAFFATARRPPARA